MKAKNILTILLLMMAGLQTVLAQNIKTMMTIHKSNGTASSFYVDELDSISFVQIYQNDTIEPNNKVELQLLPFLEDFHEIQSIQPLDLRAGLPYSYTAYNPLEAPEIGFFITEDSIVEDGSFTKKEEIWSTHVSIRDDRNCQIYGYMPKDGNIGATIMPNVSYAYGCIMTISGLKTITSTDVCFVTGVKQTDSSFSTEDDLQLGTFGYTIRGVDEGNYIYMLFNHLYASIDFQIYMDADYDALRTIKVKSMSLKSSQHSTSTAKITLSANDSGADPVSRIEWNYDVGSCEETLFSSNIIEPDTPFIPSTSMKSIGTCLISPGTNQNGNKLILSAIFDVYDKAGNLIRENCMIENNITETFQDILHGHSYIVKVKVCPTFLYLFNEPDLDNPTLMVEYE